MSWHTWSYASLSRETHHLEPMASPYAELGVDDLRLSTCPIGCMPPVGCCGNSGSAGMPCVERCCKGGPSCAVATAPRTSANERGVRADWSLWASFRLPLVCSKDEMPVGRRENLSSQGLSTRGVTCTRSSGPLLIVLRGGMSRLRMSLLPWARLRGLTK